MTTTADNVRVAVTGGISGAPLGTPLPTDGTTDLNAAFVDYGYVGDDGVTQAINRNTTKIKAWQNGDTVREVQTSHDLTYGFTFLETSDDVLEAYYGNAAGGVVEIKGEQGVRQSWVIEVIDGDDIIRLVIPDGQVTEQGDIAYKNGEAIAYRVRITCYPDAAGVKAYKYLDAATGS